jgi:hypothetical protein
VLDSRIYRTAFAPAVLALIVAAFSLQAPPRAITTTLAPDAFDGVRAGGELRALAREFPDRRPGSPGDALLAQRVQAQLRNAGFRTSTRDFEADTIDGRRTLRTVTALRAGLSSRRVVVLAHRDAAARGAEADLSGTETLLELARVFQGRRLGRTLELVSTSGGSGGAAGAADFARAGRGRVEAAIAVGDVASGRLRKPVVVPWSNDGGVAPARLVRTVEAAVATEVGAKPGAARASAQVARLGFPLATGEQGALNAAGMPAVTLSVSGERGPGGAPAGAPDQIERFGRAVLRSVTALDYGTATVPGPAPAVVFHNRVLPGWAIRLLIGALLLPAALAVLDSFARANRRREPVGAWLVWVLAAALPFALAGGFAALLALTGVIDAASPAAVPGGAIPLDAGALGALAGVFAVLALGWLGRRRLARRLTAAWGAPSAPAAATAAALVLVATVVCVWVANPFAAALLLPAVHLWTLAVLAEPRPRTGPALAAVAGGLVLPALVVLYYALALGLGPGRLAWESVLLVAGGPVGPLDVLAWSALAGCLASIMAVVMARRGARHETPPVTVRGPASYAGPGSLGGTESALRH